MADIKHSQTSHRRTPLTHQVSTARSLTPLSGQLNKIKSTSNVVSVVRLCWYPAVRTQQTRSLTNANQDVLDVVVFTVQDLKLPNYLLTTKTTIAKTTFLPPLSFVLSKLIEINVWRQLVFHNISFRQYGAQITERRISLDHFCGNTCTRPTRFSSAALVPSLHKPPNNTSFRSSFTRPILCCAKSWFRLPFASNKIIIAWSLSSWKPIWMNLKYSEHFKSG